MDPFSIAGVSLEALGIGAKTIRWIKNVVSKKILVTPNEIETTTKHWDSTTSVVVQNITNKPLFAIQIVCWFQDGQTIEFKPHHMKKLQTIKGVSIDTAFYTIKGSIDEGRRLYILELGRLLPNESLEIDLQIKGKGKVNFLAVQYDEKVNKTILKDGNGLNFPFSPPFNMNIEAISFWMKKEVGEE